MLLASRRLRVYVGLSRYEQDISDAYIALMVVSDSGADFPDIVSEDLPCSSVGVLDGEAFWVSGWRRPRRLSVAVRLV